MWTIASWNVNSLKVRLPQVLQWLDIHDPDVLALQETKTQDESFPAFAFDEAGYQVVFSGQKTYNGVAVLSRKAIQVLHTGLPGLDDPQKRVLCALVDDILRAEPVRAERFRGRFGQIRLQTRLAGTTS